MNSIGSLPKSNTYEGPTLPELTAGKALITVAILIAGVAGLCKFFGTQNLLPNGKWFSIHQELIPFKKSPGSPPPNLPPGFQENYQRRKQ